MKLPRLRLSTLMLLVVIVAPSIALGVQQRQAARREAEQQARLVQSWPLFLKKQKTEEEIKLYSRLIVKYQVMSKQLKAATTAITEVIGPDNQPAKRGE
jgi:hypothetical protein